MPKPPLPEKITNMLARPNHAVISTVRPDGQPVSVATWYLWENGRALINMDGGRKRLEYLRNDPRISLTVLDKADWHNHVSLQGRVVDLRDDPDFADIDRISRHYIDMPYPDHSGTRVSGWIEVDRWHGWAALAP